MARNCSLLFTTLLASGLVILGACKKEDGKSEPGTKGTTAEKADGKSGAAPSAGATDDLSLLPVDSEAVIGLNFAQLSQSPLWKKFVEPQMMKGDFQQKLGQFKEKCGFDPMAAIKTMSIGMKGVGGDKPDGVIVVHGPGKKESLDCFEKMKDEAAKSGDEITRVGDIVTVKSKSGEPVAITFVNDTTAIAVVGMNATPDGVKKAAQGGSTLKTSPAFVEMYGKINTQASMWLLMNGNAKAFEKAAAMGVKPKAVFGSINVTDGLSVDMRMRLDSADQAAQMANAFKGQLSAFQSMVDKMDISSEAADVKIAVSLTQQKLEQLVKNMMQMFGGRMGGMGGGAPGMGSP
jgi:hypothetical protein